jgi:hypothetical protein
MSANELRQNRSAALVPQLLMVDCGNYINQRLTGFLRLFAAVPQLFFAAVAKNARKSLILKACRSAAVATPTGGYWSAALGCRSLLPRGAVGRADG